MKTDRKIQELIDSYGNWFDSDELMSAGKMTQSLYPYSSMFSPVQINSMTVKNRLVMAPMGNIAMCEETGRPNDKMLQYFFERAKGGVGLITSGLVPISHGVDNSITELGKLSYFPRIDRSRTVHAGWRDLAQGIHAYGAKFFIQLSAGLGRVGNPQCLVTQLKFPNSASMNPNFYIPQIPSMRLSGGKIKKIIKNTGQAAADAHAAGIDGVYLHGHEGYLLDQLTNTAFNRRKLGRYSDWQRFGVDMVKEIRRRTNPKYPIMYRIDLSLALNETYGAKMDNKSLRKFKNGRSIADTLDFIKNLIAAGVDVVDVDLGCYDNWWLPHPPASMPPGCFLDVAKITKDFLRENNILSNAGKEVPVVGVGKLGYPDLAEKALRDGMCDMVMLGRPLLADPYWPQKAFAGRVDDIRPCIGCQEGCINEFVEAGHPQCAVNPRCSFEHTMTETLQPTNKKKKVAVIGAGPGGVTAALTAAERGHDVTLFEKSSLIGGRTVPGSVAKIKYEVRNYLDWLEREVKNAESLPNFTYRPNTEVTAEQLKADGFDTVITSVGSKLSKLELPGHETAKILDATELMVKPELLGDAKSAIVVGGGVVGCETAYWLKYEKGLDVKVVEMDKYIMNHVCTANRGHLIHYLERAGVELINCAMVVGYEQGGVKINRNVSPTVPDPYLTWHPILPENIHNPLAPKLKQEMQEQVLPADVVIMAAGGRPDDALFLECQRTGAAGELFNIGDSFAVGKIHEATRSAYRLALSL